MTERERASEQGQKDRERESVCVHTPSRARYRRKKEWSARKCGDSQKEKKEKERERVVARNREKKRFPFSPVFREPDRQDSIPSTSAATSASWTINVRSHRKKRPYFLSRCLGVIFPSSCFRLCSDYLHRLPSTEIPSFQNFVHNHATDRSVAMENPVCNATRVSLVLRFFSNGDGEEKRGRVFHPLSSVFNQRKFPISRKIVSYPQSSYSYPQMHVGSFFRCPF